MSEDVRFEKFSIPNWRIFLKKFFFKMLVIVNIMCKILVRVSILCKMFVSVNIVYKIIGKGQKN